MKRGNINTSLSFNAMLIDEANAEQQRLLGSNRVEEHVGSLLRDQKRRSNAAYCSNAERNAIHGSGIFK